MENKLKQCDKCGIMLSPEELNEHDIICSYAFNQDDYKNLIPCEICSELISFEEYENHVQHCVNPLNSSLNLIDSEANEINTISNQINNDPIARAMFNVLIGTAPLVNNQINISNNGNNELLENSDELEVSQDNILDSGVQQQNTSNTDSEQEDVLDNDSEQNESNQNISDNNQNNNNLFSLLNNNSNADNSLINLFNNENIQSIIGEQMEWITPFLENVNLNNIQITSNSIFNTDNYEDLINLNDVEVGVDNIENISEMEFNEIKCSICCQQSLISRKLKCSHEFCDSCITEWLKTSKKCPICMIDLQ